jgi:hypothetical protein
VKDSYDPVKWATSAVGTYRRFLFMMTVCVLFGAWAIVASFMDPPNAIVPIGFLAVQGVALAATLRRVLLRLQSAERAAGTRS